MSNSTLALRRRSFEALKTSLAGAGKLAYFDKKAPTNVIADASPVDLGQCWYKSNMASK